MRISKSEPLIFEGQKIDPTKVGIFDAAGQILPYVVGFDTETCEIEMMIKVKDEEGEGDQKLVYLVRDESLKPLIAKFVCPGAYVMTTEGKRLK